MKPLIDNFNYWQIKIESELETQNPRLQSTEIKL